MKHRYWRYWLFLILAIIVSASLIFIGLKSSPAKPKVLPSPSLPTASPTKSPLEQPLKKATNVNLPQIEIQLNSLTIENNSVVAKLSLVSLADSVMVNFDKILGNKGFADAYLLEEKTGKKYKVLSASQALNHFLAKKQDRALYFICFYAPPAGTIVTLGIPNLATFKNLNL